MKGEIFSIFEKFIAKNFGQATYEEALDLTASRLSTTKPFVGPEVYPDKDFMLLLESALSIIQLPLQKAVYLFGRFAFEPLAMTVPHLMKRYTCSVDLLRELDGLIHVEVKKVCSGTKPPRFELLELTDGRLELIYSSERRLYDLAEGLLAGMAEHFGEKMDVEREVHSDGRCSFWLNFHD